MILIFVSSQNKNMELAKNFHQHLEEVGSISEVIDLVELDLPLFTSKVEKDRPPKIIFELEEKMGKAKGLIFVAPEYNGSIPPVLNNFTSWISRAGTDWRRSFNGKPTLIATHSGGGGSNVLVAMRLLLSYLGANVMGRQILTHRTKDLNRQSMIEILDQLRKF